MDIHLVCESQRLRVKTGRKEVLMGQLGFVVDSSLH